MRLVGVVPAAGYGTRLQPLSGSKEMICIGGRPVFDYLLGRLRVGGCSEIRITIRPEKEDLARHAADQGVTVVIAQPTSVSDSLRAAIGDLEEDDVVLSGFPDTIWNPIDGFLRLLSKLHSPSDIVLGLFGVEPLAECDRVEVDESGAIRSVEVKPAEPRSNLTWGCFAARVAVLRGLEGPEPGLGFGALGPSKRISGVYLSDDYIDIGTARGLERASLWRVRADDPARTIRLFRREQG